MKLGADKIGNPTSLINASVRYWLVLMIRDYQILKQKKVKSSVYCLQILSMYRAITKRKLLMIREEDGLHNSSYPVQGILGEKKIQAANKHPKTSNFTSQGNGNRNH